jgi:hypothetical protein
MSTDKLKALLSQFEMREVCFGSEGFHIYTPDELAKAQLGYSAHPDGTDLTGTGEGAWRKEWLVFGNGTLVGDPYFVDTSAEALPVYTATHGMGTWEPGEICGSLARFLDSLRYLKSVSPDERARIEPDETTIMDEDELAEIESKLCELSGEKLFWSDFIERHREWLRTSNS